MPKVMISDNATSYIAAANHLQMLINSPGVHGELSKRGVEWRFIPAWAPWYGGFWERLIGLTKTTLKKVLGRRFVSLETLQTIVTEIEAVMNDRPLTHVSSSIDDLEPLTPSHLLYGRNITPMSYHYHYTADDINGNSEWPDDTHKPGQNCNEYNQPVLETLEIWIPHGITRVSPSYGIKWRTYPGGRCRKDPRRGATDTLELSRGWGADHWERRISSCREGED